MDTDSNGIVVLNIGEGSILFGSFSNINWTPFSSYINLRTEIDPTGGSSYSFGTVAQFKSVPYAKIAENLKNQAFKIESNVIIPIDINDDFIVGSSQMDNNDIEFGTKRLFFHKFKGAFRAGYTNTDAWDNANRGQNSFAIGSNTKAFGSNSVAMGSLTEAISQNSTAFGLESKAIGFNSTAIGNNTIVSGSSSIAIGKYNVDDPNALFMVGNGTTNTNRNNALTIYNNGNSSLNGDATINGDLGVTGDILMNFNSEVQNPNTGFANLVPIAYGSINSTGTIAGGTGNFTVNLLNNVYTVTVASKTLTRENTSVSVIANTASFRNANATFNDGKLEVHLFASTFAKVQSDFQFILYQQ